MARAFVPKVVTANDLLEGDVIYRTNAGEWSRFLHDAEVLENDVTAKQALAVAELQHDRLVGVYLADVLVDADGIPQPNHFREEFRTRGPSNYLDHGKQAEV